MMPLLSLIAGFALLVLGLVVNHRIGRLPVPPTIPPPDDTKKSPWEYYRDWSEILGPIISLKSYTNRVIVINTIECVMELLEKRKVFASKPRWPMAELLGRQNNVGFAYYGHHWKGMRKLLHSTVFADISHKWGYLLDDHSVILCRAIMESPLSFYNAVERVPQQLIIRLTYGHEADEEYLSLVNKVNLSTAEALQPGRWLVNLFPTLKYLPAWFPGAGFKQWAQAARLDFLTMVQAPFHETKRKHENGGAPASFVQECLEKFSVERSVEEENQIMFAAGSLFVAGTETITGTILVFIALMLHNEDVQERAYQEITEIIGNTRLPCLEDQRSLPYVNAIIREVQRFHPVVPLVSHGNSEEDYYDGWRIPKDTWVIANVWAILHDKTIYSNPNKFEPERFLPQDRSPPMDPEAVVFGFGRRRCPGAEFANNFLYLVISRLLALFKIEPLNSLPLSPLEFKVGLMSPPKRFNCQFRPRPLAQDALDAVDNPSAALDVQSG